MERAPKKEPSESTYSRSAAGHSAASFSTHNDFASAINNSPLMIAQRQTLQRLFGDAIQLQPDEEEPMQGRLMPVQRVEDENIGWAPRAHAERHETGSPAQLQPAPAPKPNQTGLPDHLKTGIESLSGISLDDVRVHYNSSQPAQLNALAYAQDTDIHVAPGQEQHLPHEAWHIVQQAQGRVTPTMQAKGVPINDENGLEAEADVMGVKAMQMQEKQGPRADPIGAIGPRQAIIFGSHPKQQQCVIQGKYPTQNATPLLHDAAPHNHPEYELYRALMMSLSFADEVIENTWNLLLQGFREQDFIQHQLEQLEFGEGVLLDQNLRNIIRNDNIRFQEVATMMGDYLSVGGRSLALWSGGLDLSPYAHERGYVPLEETPLGMVINQIEFHRDWILQAPLWNILSTVFVRQQPLSVHVFLRTFEADAVLFRQEVPVIREIFPAMPIHWHAIYTREDGTMREINDNLALVDAGNGFPSEDMCVQALLQFYQQNPNPRTERGLNTILNNLPLPQPEDDV